MFMVSFENTNLPNNSYVMYVGKAGDVNSNNTILRRFMDYVNPSGFRDRPRIKNLSNILVSIYIIIMQQSQ